MPPRDGRSGWKHVVSAGSAMRCWPERGYGSPLVILLRPRAVPSPRRLSSPLGAAVSQPVEPISLPATHWQGSTDRKRSRSWAEPRGSLPRAEPVGPSRRPSARNACSVDAFRGGSCRPAEPAGTGDRRAGRQRKDQSGDRQDPVHEPQDGGSPPLPDLPQIADPFPRRNRLATDQGGPQLVGVSPMLLTRVVAQSGMDHSSLRDAGEPADGWWL